MVKKPDNPIDSMLEQVRKVIVGYPEVTEKVAYCFFAGGHVLLESVPGLAKTLMLRSFSATLKNATFTRLQMTPNLLPSDIVGCEVLDPRTNEFTIHKGPVFSNVLLADEINRTIPKTQSALLEAMAEGSVSLAGKTMKLPRPFLVGATQNPIDQEGTYPLPEAQHDRFMFKVFMNYVSHEAEAAMLRNKKLRSENPTEDIKPVVSVEELVRLRQQIIDNTFVSDAAVKYILNLVRASRKGNPNDPSSQADPMFAQVVQKAGAGKDEEGFKFETSVAFGGSPRAEQCLMATSVVRAFHQGRDYVLPEDIKYVFPDVMRHRIILERRARLNKYTTEMAVQTLLKAVPFHQDQAKYRQ